MCTFRRPLFGPYAEHERARKRERERERDREREKGKKASVPWGGLKGNPKIARVSPAWNSSRYAILTKEASFVNAGFKL